ncbi:hypothetical protein B0T11DRAFT_101671 [Plectosphaerella cucumerina]|uniref:Uncharacterized protein n=1 Tax=Plectosphaerella cucumerina TaxID=40658 RepID=A0A8K0X2Y6_9PEZI|nr:hypothetical protein B0T11DRAFT_101671 [Plectosphaerella cucumerina]
MQAVLSSCRAARGILMLIRSPRRGRLFSQDGITYLSPGHGKDVSTTRCVPPATRGVTRRHCLKKAVSRAAAGGRVNRGESGLDRSLSHCVTRSLLLPDIHLQPALASPDTGPSRHTADERHDDMPGAVGRSPSPLPFPCAHKLISRLSLGLLLLCVTTASSPPTSGMGSVGGHIVRWLACSGSRSEPGRGTGEWHGVRCGMCGEPGARSEPPFLQQSRELRWQRLMCLSQPLRG